MPLKLSEVAQWPHKALSRYTNGIPPYRNTALSEYRLQSQYITVIIGSLNMHYSDVRRDSGKAAFNVLLLEYRVANQ